MIIKQARTRGKKVVEAKWNEIVVYKDTSGFKNYIWEWNPISEDYPNAADSTDYLNLTRNVLNYSSSYTTTEYLNEDTAEPGTNLYRLAPTSCHSRGAAMYFSFVVPAYTSIEIEGKLRGYSFHSSSSGNGTTAVYLTTTEPTSVYKISQQEDWEIVLVNEEGKESSTLTYSSDDLNTYTTTVTNDTDIDITYYMVLYQDQSTSATNYKYGLVVKYFKFTKI